MKNSSFTAVTAETANPAASPACVHQAIAGMAQASFRLEALEKQRSSLKEQLETIMLFLAEIQSIPSRNLTKAKEEEFFAQCEHWQLQIKKIKARLEALDHDITYLKAYNTDLQITFRQKITPFLQRMAEINTQKITLMSDFLKSTPDYAALKTDLTQDIRLALNKALNHPALAQAYLKNLNKNSPKSLTQKIQKLKDWFK